MSNEKQRCVRRPPKKLRPDQIGWRRGGYQEFIQRIRRRARRQAPKGTKGIQEDAQYFMRWIADERCLRVAWDHQAEHGGQAPGIDGWRYADFPETQIWSSLREERDRIRAGEYESAEDRLVEISKGPGRGTRTLALPCIHDRVVQRAVVEVLQPYLDPLFDDHSFGYRPRRGALSALAHAWHYFHEEKRTIWVTADLRDAFGRVELSRLLQIVKHYTFSDELVVFLGRVLSGSSTPGLRQGSSLSPLLLNVFLHHLLDLKWRRLYPDIRLLRFADDILLMCRTKSEALQAHDHLVELLLPSGLLVKNKREKDVVDLTPDHPAHWLGFEFQKHGKKSLRVLIAEESWEALAENLHEAHEAPNAPLRAVRCIQGWINDKGPCFKFINPDEAWDRIAQIARTLGFDEIPARQTVKHWWQRAFARWCRLRNGVRQSYYQPALSNEPARRAKGQP
jgi:retron-type reverse transcriptase